jgi:hypothetical protein
LPIHLIFHHQKNINHSIKNNLSILLILGDSSCFTHGSPKKRTPTEQNTGRLLVHLGREVGHSQADVVGRLGGGVLPVEIDI